MLLPQQRPDDRYADWFPTWYSARQPEITQDQPFPVVLVTVGITCGIIVIAALVCYSCTVNRHGCFLFPWIQNRPHNESDRAAARATARAGQANAATGDDPSNLMHTVNSALSSLKTFTVDDKSPCPICLEPLCDMPVSAGHCAHDVHAECLNAWLTSRGEKNCPVCRASLEGR